MEQLDICQLMGNGERPPPIFKGIPIHITPPGKAELNNKRLAYERLLNRANKRKLRTKRHRAKWNPKIGDLILVKDHKLSSLLKGKYRRMELLYKGSYEIGKIFGKHTYEIINIKNSQAEGRFHKQILRPYKTLSSQKEIGEPNSEVVGQEVH